MTVISYFCTIVIIRKKRRNSVGSCVGNQEICECELATCVNRPSDVDDPMSLNSQSRHYYFDTEWDLESHSRMTKKSLIPAEQIVQKRSQHKGALSQKRRPSKRKLDPLASSSSEGANADQRKRRSKQRQSNVHDQQSSEHEGASDYIPFRNSIGYGLVHSSLKETTTPKSTDPPQLPAIVSQFAHCSNPSGISDSLSAMLAMTLSSHSLQHISTEKSLIDIFDPANSQQAIYVAMQSIIEKRLCDFDGTAWDGLDGGGNLRGAESGRSGLQEDLK